MIGFKMARKMLPCHCGRPLSRAQKIAGTKKCCCCKTDYMLHLHCAVHYWNDVAKKQGYYDDLSFNKQTTKFYCEGCHDKAFKCVCGQWHNQGNDGVYIAHCRANHWTWYMKSCIEKSHVGKNYYCSNHVGFIFHGQNDDDDQVPPKNVTGQMSDASTHTEPTSNMQITVSSKTPSLPPPSNTHKEPSKRDELDEKLPDPSIMHCNPPRWKPKETLPSCLKGVEGTSHFLGGSLDNVDADYFLLTVDDLKDIPTRAKKLLTNSSNEDFRLYDEDWKIPIEKKLESMTAL